MKVLGTLSLYALFFVVFIAFMGVVVCVVMTIMARRQIKRDTNETKERIRRLLPGKDCAECGFENCAVYANSAVDGTIEYRECPFCSDGTNKRISLLWIRMRSSEKK